MKNFIDDAITLLKELIQTPSLSGEEGQTATLIENYLKRFTTKTYREKNNVWAFNKHYDSSRPSILLNSHHDTVKPNAGWTRQPYMPVLENNKLIGLGSNDAGAALVSLLAAFAFFYDRRDLKYNLIMSATAEEETSGENGIKSVLKDFGNYDFAIVGEPTAMEMAVAEKGLIVLYCQANGKAGHAARSDGINAISEAIKDINWFNTYAFPKESPLLGKVHMSVTMINAGYQHNVIPDTCTFTVDIRSTDTYTNSEIIEIIKTHITSKILKASYGLNASALPEGHVLIQAAKNLKIKLFASPTLSDQAHINTPSVKIGPGLSERSHTADEFVYIAEIEDGVKGYINLLNEILYVL